MGVQILCHLHTYMWAPSTLVRFHHQVSGVRKVSRKQLLYTIDMIRYFQIWRGEKAWEILLVQWPCIEIEESQTEVALAISCIAINCLVNIQGFIFLDSHFTRSGSRSSCWHCTCMSTHVIACNEIFQIYPSRKVGHCILLYEFLLRNQGRGGLCMTVWLSKNVILNSEEPEVPIKFVEGEVSAILMDCFEPSCSTWNLRLPAILELFKETLQAFFKRLQDLHLWTYNVWTRLCPFPSVFALNRKQHASFQSGVPGHSSSHRLPQV